MKTNKQNKKEKKNRSELQNRSDELLKQSGNGNPQPTPATETAAPAPAETLNSQPAEQPSTLNSPKAIRPYINYAERAFNRNLPVEKILAVLKRWMPREYELAQVVGQWIWITFPEQPAERVRADLAQLGFHWNNTRKCWQHPCGALNSSKEPGQKYASYHPADLDGYDAANAYNGPARTAEQVAA